MKPENSLFEKRVQALKNMIEKKIKNNKVSKYNLSYDNVIKEIKQDLINNNILNETEINKKLLNIKNELFSLFKIENSSGSFFKFDKKNSIEIERLEGHPISKGIFVNILFKSDEILITEIIRKQNSKEPIHNNHDHKSISTLKNGKLKLLIDDKIYIAEKGDLWIYKPNNYHSIEALQDSIELSIKFPPVKTW